MLHKYFSKLFEQAQLSATSFSNDNLNDIKKSAFQNFMLSGFPSTKNENYKTIDINRCLVEKNNYLSEIQSKPDISKEEMLNLMSLDFDDYFRINGILEEDIKTKKKQNENSCFIGSLQLFASEYPLIFKKYYAKFYELDIKDEVSDFNTMLASDAFVIYIKANQSLGKSVLLNDLLAGNRDGIVIRRLLVILEENSSLQLIINSQELESAEFLISQVSEIFVSEKAKLTLCILDDNSQSVTTLSSYYLSQSEKSKVDIYYISLQGEKTRNNFHINLDGVEAESKIYGLALGSIDNKYIDNFVNVNHLVPNCQSSQLFRYILQDNSIGAFCGKVYVAKDAQKTLAYQSNNNLCISDKAKMYSKPQLEIYADDVKCSHGLTTGQIDEAAVFYLESRGIPRNMARFMLIEAFANNTFSDMEYSHLKDWLFEKIKNTLHKNEA